MFGDGCESSEPHVSISEGLFVILCICTLFNLFLVLFSVSLTPVLSDVSFSTPSVIPSRETNTSSVGISG